MKTGAWEEARKDESIIRIHPDRDYRSRLIENNGPVQCNDSAKLIRTFTGPNSKSPFLVYGQSPTSLI
jgi:hypothetical protein